MFSVDPAARLLNQIEPRNGASTAAAIAVGPMTFGSIVLAAGLSAENISVLRDLYFIGVQRAGKLSVFVNCLFTLLPTYEVHESKDDLVWVLKAILPHPRCVSHIFHLDGIVQNSLEDTITVAVCCRCAILALSQMYKPYWLIKLEHLRYLFENAVFPQAITIDGALRRVDVVQLSREFREEWSIFFRPGHFIALRGQVRNMGYFVESVLSLGMVDDARQGKEYWVTLEKFQ